MFTLIVAFSWSNITIYQLSQLHYSSNNDYIQLKGPLHASGFNNDEDNNYDDNRKNNNNDQNNVWKRKNSAHKKEK